MTFFSVERSVVNISTINLDIFFLIFWKSNFVLHTSFTVSFFFMSLISATVNAIYYFPTWQRRGI